MPGLDGIEAPRIVTALPDPARALVLTTFDPASCRWEEGRDGVTRKGGGSGICRG